MAEYIKKGEAVELARKRSGCIAAAISNLPASDVVEVVRCKDCKYYGASHIKDGCVCFLDAGMCEAEPDDFCSRGVRKEDGRPN